MLKLRVREYSPAGVKGRILPATNIEYARVLNGSASLKFSLSRRAAGFMEAPFVAGLEYSTGGNFKPVPEENLFVVDQDDSDEADQSKTISFTGTNYVTWLLAHTYLGWSATSKNGERVWQTEPGKGPVSAGYLMNGMMLESRSRGWGAQITYDFTGATDSGGKTWANNEKVKAPWRHLTPLSQVLDTLSTDGLCDWATEGLKLRLFRPGTLGADNAHVSIGGRGFERIPVKSDASRIFTNLTVVPEKASHWLYLTNTGADNRFGRLEATMTQSGISSHSEATRLAQPHLADGRAVQREESYEWKPSPGSVVPWMDFTVGDHVTARARDRKQVRRVIGMVVRHVENDVTVRVIVGEKIGTAGANLKKRLSQVSVGSIIGGTGAGFPATGGPILGVPEAPQEPTVVVNAGRWLADGSAKSRVELTWPAVTMNTDATEATIRQYEVWSRIPSEVRQRDVAAGNPPVTVESWTPGVERLVSVRAQNDQGEWSAFSSEVSVTPQMPLSVIPKAPTGLAVTSNVGAFTATGPRATVTFGWSAVTKSVEDADVVVDVYRVWLDGALHAEVETITSSVLVPSQVSAELRVSAVANGLESDRSAPLTVTGALPAVFVLDPTVPVLSSSHGSVRAVWDGLYTSPAPAGAHTIRVEARVGSGAWFVQGAALDKAGEQLVSVGSIGDTVQVRFLAYDQLQRLTGTSAVASIVVLGVAFTDFDSASQERIEDLEGAVDTVTEGQVHVERMINGFNRRFTSIESPGRGFLGYENLASAIVGSWGWAEVWRNHFAADPGRRTSTVSGLAFWNGTGALDSGNGSVPWSKSGRATWSTITGRTGLSGNIGPIPSELNGARAAGDGTVTFEMFVFLSHGVTMTAPTIVGDIEILDSVGAITVPAQTPTRLWITVRKSSGPFLSTDQIRFNHRLPAGNAWFDVADLDAYPGPFQPYRVWADGSFVDDPDMRSRWLGEPNASESVMEGELVSGFTDATTASRTILSDGNKIRVIRVAQGNAYARATATGIEGVTTLYVDRGKVTGGTPEAPRVYSASLDTPNQPLVEYEPGRFHVVNDGVGYGTTRHIVLRPGAILDGTIGDEATYSNIQIYAGIVPDDAIPFHNGDEWHQLGWKPGEAEGDPDRLVIEHIHVWNGQDWVFHDIWAENIFAAGSVTAREINFTEAFGEKLELSEAIVGRINVNHLAPGFGETVNISGNLSVIGLESQVTEAQDTATNATTMAEDGAAIAALADSKAQAAQAAADSVSTDLSEHKRAFTVTDGVPEVSTLDGEYKLRLDANRIAMLHSGQEVTYWEGSKFVVREIDIIQGMLANHWIESVGDHGTVIKPRNE